MEKKIVVLGFILMVAIASLMLCTDAMAQYRTCVWPNTCIK